MTLRWKPFALLLLAAAMLVACAQAGPPQEEDAVPAGDPPFPVFSGSWVVDTTGTVSNEVVSQANTTFQKLRDDGIAEVVILVIEKIDHPELYATRYGRFIELGSSETNNGLVYLLRPDAPPGERIIYSVGRGLPALTSNKVTEATASAIQFANSDNFGQAIISLAQDTDGVLRVLYQPNPEAVTEDGEEKLTPEQQRTLIITFLVIVAIWFIIGLVLLPIDAELAAQWWILGLRILLLVATAGKASGKTGGGGKFGGRSGSR